MPVKLRLQRFGKKDTAFFHIVVADGRAPRDGAFIEKLGTYNPCTNPATIDINFDKALNWLEKGAQPTDTCRAILSYKGVMYKHHLLGGIKKGALTAEQAEAKFQKWISEKEGRVSSKKDRLATASVDAKAKKLSEEKTAKESKAAKIAAKNAATPVTEEKTETTETAEPTTEA
ncbi:MAG: 30S ribosomal protein S16 [Bacteroidia bacterium]|nr:30S ribosomal protein S16 [Bacteroidia bacterium]